MKNKYKYRSPDVPECVEVHVWADGTMVSKASDGTVFKHAKEGGCLYDASCDLIETKPWDGMEIDDKVVVSFDGDEDECHRHFAGINKNGNPMAWSDGTTSWTSDGAKTIWDNCLPLAEWESMNAESTEGAAMQEKPKLEPAVYYRNEYPTSPRFRGSYERPNEARDRAGFNAIRTAVEFREVVK